MPTTNHLWTCSQYIAPAQREERLRWQFKYKYKPIHCSCSKRAKVTEIQIQIQIHNTFWKGKDVKVTAEKNARLLWPLIFTGPRLGRNFHVFKLFQKLSRMNKKLGGVQEEFKIDNILSVYPSLTSYCIIYIKRKIVQKKQNSPPLVNPVMLVSSIWCIWGPPRMSQTWLY